MTEKVVNSSKSQRLFKLFQKVGSIDLYDSQAPKGVQNWLASINNKNQGLKKTFGLPANSSGFDGESPALL